jgi:hypothetical protein
MPVAHRAAGATSNARPRTECRRAADRRQLGSSPVSVRVAALLPNERSAQYVVCAADSRCASRVAVRGNAASLGTSRNGFPIQRIRMSDDRATQLRLTL